MSAFLGPIHYWVFKKIKFQNEIINNLIDFAKKKNFDMTAILSEQYDELESAPLEDIIDTSNIHGWLQERVSLVEYRLAAAVKTILDNGIAALEELTNLFYKIGSSLKPSQLPTAPAAYKMLNDFLLDGMPCDRANVLVSENDSCVIWRRNICVHSPYWNETGIDISIYYSLRESLIAGLLDGSGFKFDKKGEEYFIIAV